MIHEHGSGGAVKLDVDVREDGAIGAVRNLGVPLGDQLESADRQREVRAVR